MRYIIMGLAVLTTLGCGSVDAMRTDDGGAGAGGQAGAAGAGVDAAAGAGGEGGAAGSPEHDAAVDRGCVPSACNTCVNGVFVPMPDGTQCGGGLCDGVAPYVGERACTATNYLCIGGACTATSVDCCKKLGCAPNQAACTGSAEDSHQPTMCTSVCL